MGNEVVMDTREALRILSQAELPDGTANILPVMVIAEAALATGDKLSPSEKCICGEINARHCPVHSEQEKPIDYLVRMLPEVKTIDKKTDNYQPTMSEDEAVDLMANAYGAELDKTLLMPLEKIDRRERVLSGLRAAYHALLARGWGK